ncbi:MAG: hypothetical protein C0425_06880 [Chlorobiaceae bacterium]|nr:hypothetical protein [Chlorobiaceae bacterium]MBA4310046.1 hypothetical protein [Chlorobiaceae bacterium]
MRLSFLLFIFLFTGICETINSQIPVYLPQDNIFETSVSFNYFDIYRERTDISNLTAYYYEAKSGVSYKTDNFRLSLSIEESRFRFNKISSKHNALDSDVLIKKQSLAPMFQYNFKNTSATAFLSMEKNNGTSENSYGFNFELKKRILLLEKISLQLSKINIPFSASFNYDEDNLHLNKSFPLFILKQSFDFIPVHNLQSKIDLYQMWNRRGSSFADYHTITQEALFYGFEFRNDYDKNINLSIKYFEGESDLFFEHRTNLYGESSISNTQILQLEIGIDLTKRLSFLKKLQLGYLNLTSKVVGDMQSWPFTDVVTSIIANRLYYRGECNIDAFYSSLSTDFNLMNIRVSPELTFIHFEANGQIENWQPLFLVFGVKNFSSSPIDILKLGAIHFSLQTKINFEEISLLISAGQLLPIYKVKKAIVTTPGLPTPSVYKKSDGGRWISMVIIKYFN